MLGAPLNPISLAVTNHIFYPYIQYLIQLATDFGDSDSRGSASDDVTEEERDLSEGPMHGLRCDQEGHQLPRIHVTPVDQIPAQVEHTQHKACHTQKFH